MTHRERKILVAYPVNSRSKFRIGLAYFIWGGLVSVAGLGERAGVVRAHRNVGHLTNPAEKRDQHIDAEHKAVGDDEPFEGGHASSSRRVWSSMAIATK